MSNSPGTAAIEAAHATPVTGAPSMLTATTLPPKPPRSIELIKSCTRSPWPYTTIRSGLSSRRTDALSARCSRRSMTPTEVSVGKIGNSTASTPSSMPLDTR